MKFFVEKGLPSLRVRGPQLGYIYIWILMHVMGYLYMVWLQLTATS